MKVIEEIKAELTRIKGMFASKHKFAQATLEDGTVVEWDGELVAGTELFVVDGETRIPAPIGTHTTTEGLQVVVEEVGVVKEVIEAVVEEEQSKTEDIAIEEMKAETTLNVGLSKDEVEVIVNEKMSAITKVMDDLLKVAESTQRELEAFKAKPSTSEREKTKFTKEGGDLTPRQQFLLNNLKK
jgi:hypothetical protein